VTMPDPPLVPLHADETLICSKLAALRKLSTDNLIDSLRPGKENALRTRPHGTVMNGNHRIKVLRDRGVNVDQLPREIVEREVPPEIL
jgi:hypothetical protein